MSIIFEHEDKDDIVLHADSPPRKGDLIAMGLNKPIHVVNDVAWRLMPLDDEYTYYHVKPCVVVYVVPRGDNKP